RTFGTLFLLSLLVTFSGPAARAQSPQASKWIAQLPEAPAKGIIVAKCQVCHSLQRVVVSHRRADEWKDLVDTMVSRGAALTPDEIPVVADYLSANFGLASASGAAPISSAAAPTLIDPDQAQFAPASTSLGLPGGIQAAIVSGNPEQARYFSMLLSIPAGQT